MLYEAGHDHEERLLVAVALSATPLRSGRRSRVCVAARRNIVGVVLFKRQVLRFVEEGVAHVPAVFCGGRRRERVVPRAG